MKKRKISVHFGIEISLIQLVFVRKCYFCTKIEFYPFWSINFTYEDDFGSKMTLNFKVDFLKSGL